MEKSANIKGCNIPNIFQSMAYGANLDNMQEALDWLKCSKDNVFFAYVDKPTEKPNGVPFKLENVIKNECLCTIHIPEIETIQKVLSKTTDKKWADQDSLEKTKILYKISTEIEKRSDLFAQLEMLTRGILSKDTKHKALPLLAQYFRYYSAFAFTSVNESSRPKPLGTAVGIISNENYLAYLGLLVAPALAAGCNVVLQVGTQLTPAAFLLQDIAKAAGLPDGTFKIIPSDDGELLPYLSSQHVDIITLFVDLNNEKYKGINSLNKKILALSSYKTPAIIFESADLESASESVIESSWSYQSLLPWSTDTILVQENVLETFFDKLKSKLCTLKVAAANDTAANISIANKSSLESLNKLINQAKFQGIEVFQAQHDSTKWTPTLLKGGRVNTNNALGSNENEAKAVTILAFRSIDEAVNLANNNWQGLWASVWSDNVGVVNEVSRKLKVSNIWINSSYGLITPEVVISPIKESGTGNFGGKEGYLEYLCLKKTDQNVSFKNTSAKSTLNIDALVNSAKAAQQSWQKVPRIQKQKIFQEFADYILRAKNAGSPEQSWLTSTLKHVYTAIKDCYKGNISSTISRYHLTSACAPRGIVVIDKHENLNIQLILTALFEGNSLILLGLEGDFENTFKFLSQKLPNSVLNIVPYDQSHVKKLAANKQIGVFFGNDSDHIFGSLPLRDSKNYRAVSDVREDLYGKIVYIKNVWSDIGKSSTCNFN